jgi:transposase
MFGKDSNTLNISANLLGLSDVEVTKVTPNLDSYQIIIQVKSTKKEIPCRVCGKPTSKNGVARTLRFRHLPIFEQDTFIEITPRRGKCQNCDGNPSTNEKMDWYDEKSKFTKAFEHRMLFDLVNSTVADVSRKSGVDYHTVDNLIDRYIETEVNFDDISKLGVIGIDEISMKKGYRDFVTLITYRFDNKVRILGVVDGREKADLAAFFAKIPSHLTKTIKVVCSDLYEGYLNACKEIFGKKIPIVADRFHVRRLYRKCLVNLRKSKLRRLRKELSDNEYKKLSNATKLLRKNKDYFTDEEKIIVTTSTPQHRYCH